MTVERDCNENCDSGIQSLDPDKNLSEDEKAAIDKKLLFKLDCVLIPWNNQNSCVSFIF